MKKYNEPIYDKEYVQEALKISWWEKLLLFFIPSVRVENEDTVSHFKTLRGKFYLMDFEIKSLVHPKEKEEVGE